MEPFAFCLLVWLVPILGAGAWVLTRPAKRWRVWGGIAVVFAAAWSVICVPWVARVYEESRCGASGLVFDNWLRLAIATRASEIQRGGSIASLAELAAPEEVGRHGDAFVRFCSAEGPDEAMVGGFTLREVREDPAKLAIARAEAEASGEAWERVGRFLLSRERGAFQSEDGRVVVGVALALNIFGQTSFGFADLRTEWVRIGDDKFRAIVEGDRAARAERQLAPPPDWEGMVREFLEAHPRVEWAGRGE